MDIVLNRDGANNYIQALRKQTLLANRSPGKKKDGDYFG